MLAGRGVAERGVVGIHLVADLRGPKVFPIVGATNISTCAPIYQW